jgi:hypothetical protein
MHTPCREHAESLQQRGDTYGLLHVLPLLPKDSNRVLSSRTVIPLAKWVRWVAVRAVPQSQHAPQDGPVALCAGLPEPVTQSAQ